MPESLDLESALRLFTSTQSEKHPTQNPMHKGYFQGYPNNAQESSSSRSVEKSLNLRKNNVEE